MEYQVSINDTVGDTSPVESQAEIADLELAKQGKMTYDEVYARKLARRLKG